VPDDDLPPEKLHISLSQMLASSAAAVSAAVLCSLFGVAGTIIGTAVASLLATIGTAVYVHSLRRTKVRLRRLHQAGAASPPIAEVIKTARQQGRHMFDQISWRAVAAGAAGIFVLTIAIVTAIEVRAGKPLSALFGVSHSGNRTTTIGSDFGFGGHRRHRPRAQPTPTTTTTPAPTATVTVTPTPTPTVTVTQTAPLSPSPSANSTAPTSPSPSSGSN
jgi:hypothetical protein